MIHTIPRPPGADQAVAQFSAHAHTDDSVQLLLELLGGTSFIDILHARGVASRPAAPANPEPLYNTLVRLAPWVGPVVQSAADAAAAACADLGRDRRLNIVRAAVTPAFQQALRPLIRALRRQGLQRRATPELVVGILGGVPTAAAVDR